MPGAAQVPALVLSSPRAAPYSGMAAPALAAPSLPSVPCGQNPNPDPSQGAAAAMLAGVRVSPFATPQLQAFAAPAVRGALRVQSGGPQDGQAGVLLGPAGQPVPSGALGAMPRRVGSGPEPRAGSARLACMPQWEEHVPLRGRAAVSLPAGAVLPVRGLAVIPASVFRLLAQAKGANLTPGLGRACGGVKASTWAAPLR